MNSKEYKEKFNAKKSPLQAIKMKCWDCCGGNSEEVKQCTCKDTCVLWPFRLGKNPWKPKRTLTEEEREALVTRLKHARLASETPTTLGSSEQL